MLIQLQNWHPLIYFNSKSQSGHVRVRFSACYPEKWAPLWNLYFFHILLDQNTHSLPKGQTARLFCNGSIRMLVIKGEAVIAFIIKISLIRANCVEKHRTLSHCWGVKRSLCGGNVPQNLWSSVLCFFFFVKQEASFLMGTWNSPVVVEGINSHLLSAAVPTPLLDYIWSPVFCFAGISAFCRLKHGVSPAIKYMGIKTSVNATYSALTAPWFSKLWEESSLNLLFVFHH